MPADPTGTRPDGAGAAAGSDARVALVTSGDEQLADPEVHETAAALRAAGIAAEVVVWDEERDWSTYALVVIRSPWDYIERLVEFLEWTVAVERQSVLLNPPDVLRWSSHKGYLVELAAKGVPTVPTRLIPGTSVDVADQVREVPWEEIVVKAAVDGGGRHSWRGRRDDPTLSRVVERMTDQGDVVVQPFVEAIAEGERSLVFLGGRLSHAVRKVPAEGDYRSQRHLGGVETDHEPDSAELQVALAAMAEAPGRLSYARVDLVDWEGTPVVIELELVEPDLFLRGVPERMERFADLVRDELEAVRAEP